MPPVAHGVDLLCGFVDEPLDVLVLFLPAGRTHFFYLVLNPKAMTSAGGKRYRRKALLRWGPRNCFYADDLYTIKLGAANTDAIERYFFGPIDQAAATRNLGEPTRQKRRK